MSVDCESNKRVYLHDMLLCVGVDFAHYRYDNHRQTEREPCAFARVTRTKKRRRRVIFGMTGSILLTPSLSLVRHCRQNIK